MDDGADAGGTGMYRLRRSARPFAWTEGTRRRRANKWGWPFFWWLFFGHAKKSHSPSRAAAAKPHRGRSPRVLRGEAVPLRRGTTLHQAMTLPTPHP